MRRAKKKRTDTYLRNHKYISVDLSTEVIICLASSDKEVTLKMERSNEQDRKKNV